MRSALLVSLLALVAAAPARAADVVARAAARMRADPIYVDPAAEGALDQGERIGLEHAIVDSGAEPVYIAVLPKAGGGNDPADVAHRLARAVGRRGAYAVVVGRTLRGAQLNEPGLATGDAARLALEAGAAHRGARPYAALRDFIRRVAQERANPPSHRSRWSPVAVVSRALLLAAALGFGLAQRRRRAVRG